MRPTTVKAKELQLLPRVKTMRFSTSPSYFYFYSYFCLYSCSYFYSNSRYEALTPGMSSTSFLDNFYRQYDFR